MNGKIAKRSIQLDPRRKAFLVTASFTDNDVLFVGDTVNLIVETGGASESIWIPVDAFRKNGKKSYVFLMENSKAVTREITIGERNEQFVQVLSGLETGKQLIIAGLDKIEDGTGVVLNVSL